MSSTVNTPASGTVDVNVTFAGTLAIGTRVTALAIDSTTLDTSEFSNCATAEATDFIVTPTSGLQTTENGGQATFTVRLTTLPSAQVHIVPSVSDATEASVGPSHLTFTQTNARTPQTVTVTGLPDGIVDGNIPFTVVLASATSSDPGYNGRNPTDVSATNLDNGVSCTPRPKVTVVAAPESDERLRVTLSATGANNKLTQIQGISTTNAALETAALPPQTGTFLIPLGSVSSYSFVVHRLASGQPGTVRFYVRDGCGDWPTFVGGGVNGFP
jgi:hypothetical protein